jgi:DNA polymerase I-like protein with 3'-5' exonuclease and polymerase domains
MKYRYITKPDYEITFGEILGVDTETNGLDFLEDNLLLIQVSDGRNTYVFDARVLPKKYLEWLAAQLEQRTCIFHNSKFDIKFLRQNTGYNPTKVIDTMIGAALLVAGKRNSYIGLKDLTQQYLGFELDKEEQSSFLNPSIGFTDGQLEYAAKDAIVLLDVWEHLKEDLEKWDLERTARLEFNLVPIVAGMEFYGIGFDYDRLLPVIEELGEQADKFEQRLWDIAGKEFNPRSYKQVLEIFHKLGVDVDSTSKDVIKYVDHPFAKTLLDYRSVYKLYSTYGAKLVEKVGADGRIHAEFNQVGTASGRFSSRNPNLQNIPHTNQFRVPFVAAPGYNFITADFSQIELRLAGILSGEQAIIEEYHREDADLHRLTGSKIFKCSPEDVTKEQRFSGKTANFSVLYGTSPKSLSIKSEIPYSMAEKIVDGFWEGYPRLHGYVNSEGRKAIRNGYNRTELGRIRWYKVPKSSDSNFNYKYWQVMRMSSNNKIQGFAADIMKYAIIRAHQAVKNFGRIVITVHDEIGVEISKDVPPEEAKALVVNAMEEAGAIMVNHKVPLKVNAVLEDSWVK